MRSKAFSKLFELLSAKPPVALAIATQALSRLETRDRRVESRGRIGGRSRLAFAKAAVLASGRADRSDR